MSAPSAYSGPAAQPLDHPWPAMWSLVIGFFMILVDSTIVSIATPALMRAFGAGITAVVWVTSAYLLAYAVPLLITGRLGDRYGPKKIYLVGLTIFTIASLACGLAPTIEVLIAARVVQGLGASLMTPQTMAVITRIFPPDRRGTAMGLWGAVAGVASLVGPILGGILIDTLGWEWIFFVNLPVGVVAFLAVVRNVPRLERHSHRFDWLGVTLNVVGMFLVVFGIQEGPTYNWGTITGPLSVWSLIISGLVVLGLFGFVQARHREPLAPPVLFRDRNFSVANSGILVMGFLITSMVFPITLFAQTARGLTPTQTALLSLPVAVVTGVLAPVVGKMINRSDPKWFAVGGYTIMVGSLVLYAWLMRPGISILWLLLPSALLGVANSGIWGPLSVSATRNLPPHQAGAGSGIYNTTRQIGAVLGSAAIAAFMGAQLTAQLGARAAGSEMATMGTRVPAALEAGYSAAMSRSMLLPAAVAVIGIVAALLLAPPHGRRTPEGPEESSVRSLRRTGGASRRDTPSPPPTRSSRRADMRVHIATDHAGFELKEFLVARLKDAGWEVVDHGAAAYDPEDDYPTTVIPCAQACVATQERGIVLGGSGNGEQLAANKVPGCRAALAYSAETARLARRHNDAHVIGIGARMHTTDEAWVIAREFLTTDFSGDERHVRRLAQIAEFEQKGTNAP